MSSVYSAGLASNDQNETDRYIGNRALDCLYYLDRRVDFWRQQNPMYSRQRERRRKLNQHSSAHGRGGRYNRDPMQYILQQLEEIDDGFILYRLSISLVLACTRLCADVLFVILVHFYNGSRLTLYFYNTFLPVLLSSCSKTLHEKKHVS